MQIAQTRQNLFSPLAIGPKFRNKAGDLTSYALACGYVQQFERGDKRVTLWHEGGPAYHVRAHDFATGTRITWETFETLTAARKYWRTMRRQIQQADQ